MYVFATMDLFTVLEAILTGRQPSTRNYSVCMRVYVECFLLNGYILFSKIQLVVYYQCCVLIGLKIREGGADPPSPFPGSATVIGA